MEKTVNNTKSTALGEEKISKLVLKFASTTFIALMINSIYTLIDSLFVSWGVGDNAMGAVSIVFPFLLLQGAISTALGGGAGVLVAKRLGEDNAKAAGQITLNAMITFLVTAVITTIIGFIFMTPILKFFGATEALLPQAKQYFSVILIGNIFSTGFSSIIRAEGKMTYGMLIWVIPISVNIILDGVFIFLFKWGVLGSAVATVIAQSVSFSMSILFFTRFSTQTFKGAKLKIKSLAEILAIGLPSLAQSLCLSVSTIIINNALANVAETLGLNTFAYISKIITFAIAPMLAISQALIPIASFNHGAKKEDRARGALNFCLILSLVYSIFAILISQVLAQYLMRIFTQNAQIISMGASGLRIVSLSFIFVPIPLLIGSSIQARGKKLWAYLSYCANLIFLLPIVALLSSRFAINGVWWAYTLASVCASVVAIGKYLYDFYKRKKRVLKLSQIKQD